MDIKTAEPEKEIQEATKDETVCHSIDFVSDDKQCENPFHDILTLHRKTDVDSMEKNILENVEKTRKRIFSIANKDSKQKNESEPLLHEDFFYYDEEKNQKYFKINCTAVIPPVDHPFYDMLTLKRKAECMKENKEELEKSTSEKDLNIEHSEPTTSRDTKEINGPEKAASEKREFNSSAPDSSKLHVTDKIRRETSKSCNLLNGLNSLKNVKRTKSCDFIFSDSQRNLININLKELATKNEKNGNISCFQQENDLSDNKEESCIPCKSELSKSDVKLASEKEGESSLNNTGGELNQIYSAFEGLHLILHIRLTCLIFLRKNISNILTK